MQGQPVIQQGSNPRALHELGAAGGGGAGEDEAEVTQLDWAFAVEKRGLLGGCSLCRGRLPAQSHQNPV